ncbi:MAG: pantoate--beta-alanine ligase [Planctomycetota bacterium]
MTLERLDDAAAVERWSRTRRAARRTLGFVPTMGALHEGHLTLVRRALESEGVCAVSIFVNPLQFDDSADLARYPRDFERDAELLERAGASLVFTGTLASFFGTDDPKRVEREVPGPAARVLEGASRPGHFDGVATIVRRLFELVRPTRAFFGEKDFQQTLVVRSVAERLGFPAIEVVPTVREPDGLALSSRNARLDAAGRERALALSRGLFAARAAWRAGERVAAPLAALLRAPLDAAALDVEYAVVRDPERFIEVPAPDGALERARALVAAFVDAPGGRVRLIDTLELSSTPSPSGTP